MLETYRGGGDIHAQTTSVIYNIPIEQAADKSAAEYKDRRAIAKGCNFGCFYGLFPKGLQRTLKFKAGLDTPLAECEKIIANLKAGYPQLSLWQEVVKRQAKVRRYSETWLGRRRYLPGIVSDDWGKKSFAERCAMNTPIQGTAADILKLALGRLIVELPDYPWLRPLLQIHDELVFELPADKVERVEKLTQPEDWKRAYAELNDFEEQLQEHNNILLKFWLHISPDEQLRRFKEREEIPWKNYKITPDDWRNREKWPAYVEAADEMFLRTSTEYAPWHIIPAEDKKCARLDVIRIYRDALRKALEQKKKK